MQTAQRIVRAYRRKRMVLCFIIAFATLVLILAVRFFSTREEIRHDIQYAQQQAAATLDKLLQPVLKNSLPAQFASQPCENVQQALRLYIARQQILRAISLVADGHVYCSSVFGPVHLSIHQLHPQLPSPQPQALLDEDQLLLKNTPVLLVWSPTITDEKRGVIQVVDIGLVTELIQAEHHYQWARIIISLGDKHYEDGTGMVNSMTPGPGQNIYTQPTQNPAISVSLITPGPSVLARHALPSQLPLALLVALVVGYAVWVGTASRMSFAWELNLGLATREFALFCQPLLDASDGHCKGVEILLRWDNPRQGWISPEAFIPIAEQQHLVAQLTRYVMSETVQRLHFFPQEKRFHIAINVAAGHFRHGEIIQDVKKYWLANRPHQQLLLELTERDSLANRDCQYIPQLKSLGVMLAVDDFGTGHSSLQWLESLRPDVLKIDKIFTAAIGTDAVNSTVMDIIIALGHRLKIDLIAEGVETAPQAAYLRKRGVSTLQGYLYSHPMPIDDFPRWLENYEPTTRGHYGIDD